MTVSLPSSLPIPGATERTKPDQKKIDQQARDRQAFRALLEQESADPAGTVPARLERPVAYPAVAGLEGGIAINANGQSYSLSLGSSDRAVSFEARPIVGPAYVEQVQLSDGETVATSQLLPRNPKPASLSDGALGQIPASALDAQTLAQSVAGSAGTARPGLSGPMLRPEMAAPDLMLRPGGSPATAAASNASSASARMQDAQLSGRSSATSAVMQAPLDTARRAQVFAQLLASTDQYHVVVRGVQASRMEQRELASAIKSALRAYGLPDRPVVISMIEAEG